MVVGGGSETVFWIRLPENTIMGSGEKGLRKGRQGLPGRTGCPLALEYFLWGFHGMEEEDEC